MCQKLQISEKEKRAIALVGCLAVLGPQIWHMTGHLTNGANEVARVLIKVTMANHGLNAERFHTHKIHTQNTHAKRKSIYSVTAIYLLYIISVSCSSLPYSGALPLSLSNKHGGILLWQIRTDTVSHGQWTILVQRAARVYETLVTLLACVKPERLISKSDRISLRVNRV